MEIFLVNWSKVGCWLAFRKPSCYRPFSRDSLRLSDTPFNYLVQCREYSPATWLSSNWTGSVAMATTVGLYCIDSVEVLLRVGRRVVRGSCEMLWLLLTILFLWSDLKSIEVKRQCWRSPSFPTPSIVQRIKLAKNTCIISVDFPPHVPSYTHIY